MTKTRKDIANGIKETTRQMYEKTLSEMREKGVDKDTIEMVEKLKNSLDTKMFGKVSQEQRKRGKSVLQAILSVECHLALTPLNLICL